MEGARPSLVGAPPHMRRLMATANLDKSTDTEGEDTDEVEKNNEESDHNEDNKGDDSEAVPTPPTTKERKRRAPKTPATPSEPKSKRVRKATAAAAAAAAEKEAEDKEDGDQQEQDGDDGDGKKRRKRKPTRFSTPKQIKSSRKSRKEPKEEKAEGEEEEEKKEPEKEKTPEVEKPRMQLPDRERLKEYSPLQLLLDFLLREFQRKDPEEYFTFPVTDDIAPDYSEKISTPMDYYTIRNKIDKDEYKNVDEFKTDIDLICTNAIEYNEEHTIYSFAARKLRTVADFVFSQENFEYLSRTLPFFSTVDRNLIGHQRAPNITSVSGSGSKQKSHAGFESCVVDNLSAKQVLMSSRRAAKKVADRLAARTPHETHLSFLNTTPDGCTTLSLVTPEHLASGEEATKRKTTRLGDLLSTLKEGNPGVAPFRELKKNVVVPVNYLDYGSYSSFAPQYDSTWASLNKTDSDRLLASYGDRANAAYAYSLQSFVESTDASITRMVSGLLDSLTDGQHTKTMAKLGLVSEDEKRAIEEEISQAKPEDNDIDFDELKSLADLGIDVSFIDRIESNRKKTDKPDSEFDSKLARGAELLAELQESQLDRLAQAPEHTLTDVHSPDKHEAQLANSVLQNITGLVSKTKPACLVQSSSVHRSMGIVAPTDDIDLDVMREFFC